MKKIFAIVIWVVYLLALLTVGVFNFLTDIPAFEYYFYCTGIAGVSLGATALIFKDKE